MLGRRAYTALNLLAVLFLLIALTPFGETREARPRLVVLVDLSRSVSADVSAGFARIARALRPRVADFHPEGRVWIVPFAARPEPWLGPVSVGEAQRAFGGEHDGGPPSLPESERWGTREDLALWHADRLLGSVPGGTVLMIGDGRGGGTSALDAARALATRGHRLYTLPAPVAAPDGDLFLQSVHVPLQVAPGAPVDLRIRVGGTGRAARPFRLVVREESVTDEAAEQVRSGVWTAAGPAAFDLRYPGRRRSALRSWHVRLEEPRAPPGCRSTRADAMWVSVLQGDPIRVLWVGKPSRPPAAFVRLGDGFTVRVRRLTEPVLAETDVVILQDVRFGSAKLRAGQTAALERAVVRGLGLLATGVEDAFGPGGWQGTELERMLPVRLARPGPRIDAVLLLDRSGSMGTGDRWSRAATAAQSFVSGLEPGDRVRVVTFAADPRLALDWQTVPARRDGDGTSADLSREVRRRLHRIRPRGPTNLISAVEAAIAAFRGRPEAGPEPRRSRLLLLSDGRLGEPLDAYLAWGARLQGAGIRIGVVATGDSLDPEGRARLDALTAAGANGRVVVVAAGEDLEGAFRAAGNPDWWIEGPLDVVRTENALPDGLALGARPFSPVDRLVRTLPRPGVGTLIAVTGESQPVLALGRYGDGRTAAFPGAVGGARPGGWNRPETWRPLLRWLTRREPGVAARPTARARLARGRLEIEVRLPKGAGLTGWQFRWGGRQWPLAPVGSRRLGATVDVASVDANLAAAAGELLEGRTRRIRVPVRRSPGEELRQIGANLAALRTLGEQGGGRCLIPAEDPSAWPPPPGGESGGAAPIWPLLALAAFFAARGVKSLWIRGR
jgi:hypothetical protein